MSDQPRSYAPLFGLFSILLLGGIAVAGYLYWGDMDRTGPAPSEGSVAADLTGDDEPETTGELPSAPIVLPEQERAIEGVNIVIFLIDTLRQDRVGAYGYEGYETTPYADFLATESVLFEQAYAPSPWTLPTIASLLTSKHQCEHQTIAARRRLPDELSPLAERLKRAGYTTMGVFANSFASKQYGFDRGYDYYKYNARTDGHDVSVLLDRLQGRPFFLYVHNLEPHTPYHYALPHTPGLPDVTRATRRQIKDAYKAYRSLTRADYHNKRPLGTTDNSAEQDAMMAKLNGFLREYKILYDSAVRYADSRMGSAIAALKRRGAWDKTLFIFLADHGEEMNDHGGWLHDQSAYEELMRVPLMIKFPNGEFGGTRVHEPVSLVDIMPTLAAYLKMPSLAENARGRNLLPLIRGEVEPSDAPYVPGMRMNIVKYYRPWKESRGDINVVVRQGSFKGIWNVEPETFELYDLSSDPGERTNIADAHPDQVATMREYADEWLRECLAASPGGEDTVDLEGLDEETLKNLRALGYID
jgi:arylsulfatase A-like enzyme